MPLTGLGTGRAQINDNSQSPQSSLGQIGRHRAFRGFPERGWLSLKEGQKWMDEDFPGTEVGKGRAHGGQSKSHLLTHLSTTLPSSHFHDCVHALPSTCNALPTSILNKILHSLFHEAMPCLCFTYIPLMALYSFTRSFIPSFNMLPRGTSLCQALYQVPGTEKQIRHSLSSQGAPGPDHTMLRV